MSFSICVYFPKCMHFCPSPDHIHLDSFYCTITTFNSNPGEVKVCFHELGSPCCSVHHHLYHNLFPTSSSALPSAYEDACHQLQWHVPVPAAQLQLCNLEVSSCSDPPGYGCQPSASTQSIKSKWHIPPAALACYPFLTMTHLIFALLF